MNYKHLIIACAILALAGCAIMPAALIAIAIFQIHE